MLTSCSWLQSAGVYTFSKIKKNQWRGPRQGPRIIEVTTNTAHDGGLAAAAAAILVLPLLLLLLNSTYDSQNFTKYLSIPEPGQDPRLFHDATVVLKGGLEKRQLEEHDPQRPYVHLLANLVPLEQINLLGRPISRRRIPPDLVVRRGNILGKWAYPGRKHKGREERGGGGGGSLVHIISSQDSHAYCSYNMNTSCA